MTAPNRVGKRSNSRWARNKSTASYLGISVMTLWRWKHDPTLGFPPATVINSIEHNDLDAVDGWMQSHAVTRPVDEEVNLKTPGAGASRPHPFVRRSR
jgi:predicted DNA-binding transcriptional regulator AlpA